MVKWKGIDLKDKGIIVEESPQIPKAKREFETYKIDGRNGVLTVDKGTYSTTSLSLKCHFDTERANIDEIKAFLDGYGTLSLENDREYTAIINNQISFEKVLRFRKFVIQFLVNPISYSVSSTTKNVTGTPTTFEITDATAEMQPMIEIQGTDNVEITINNKTFHLSELENGKTYKLDCGAKEILDNNNLNSSNKMSGDFPTLKPGMNTIEYNGTITNFKITYKKAYL